mmetsp:Transcript_60707/g.125028  ORF Transcript_60707/g.125028 Transcript_60707/m.125028 type:complete len:464 (+) Transcript_60707:176-1567(+)|eukprot:CAMPEP_0181316056 /NCGR_PEP_ID=MMETSP1101-20121128/15694_1 /TAXON_ID=46948 /ORGANISM="Rhodomonas abbreviata, Strain Caron Lab Isolate" /LENGTH=463 /DNA_ID=CAMNT_0023423283 /DNA_START=395 /DNA_END=1786 /DNA_ORIENTATION=+
MELLTQDLDNDHDLQCTQAFDSELSSPAPRLLLSPVPSLSSELSYPSSFVLSRDPDHDPTAPAYFLVGRAFPDSATLPFSDNDVPSPQLSSSFLDLSDSSRPLQAVSRQHAILKLSQDQQLFLRDWKAHGPSRTTRVYNCSASPQSFVPVSSSDWTPLPHHSLVHFLPYAPPPSVATGPPLPCSSFRYRVHARSSGPSPRLPSTSPLPSLHSSPSLSCSPSPALSEVPSGPRGLFGFKILLEGRQVGPVMGVRAANLHGIQDSTSSRLRFSERNSFFPGSAVDRVLFVSSPTSSTVVEGCLAVLSLLASDRGKEGTRPPPTYMTFRAAYPPAGPLLDADSFRDLQSAFPACSLLLSSAVKGTRDRILSLHGLVADVRAAVVPLVQAVPPDAYPLMEADYQSSTAQPDTSKQRKLHRAALSRKRKQAARDRDCKEKGLAGTKRARGRWPSDARRRPHGGRSHRS